MRLRTESPAAFAAGMAVLCVLSAGCGQGKAGERAAQVEPDSVAAALEAEMSKYPERYAEEPVPVIEVAEVRALMQSGDVVVVDAREPEAYARGHLRGSVNVPYGNWLEDGKPLPPKDRDVIVYCNSQDCPIGRLWAGQAVQRGYTRVRHMKAGFRGWQEAGLDVATGAGPQAMSAERLSE